MIITDEVALRIKCEPVLAEEIGPLIEQLERELHYSAKNGNPGLGLAAPQIGIGKNVCIVRTNTIKLNLVNARIAAGYNKQIFEGEGCLSFPGRFEKTMRYQEIFVVDNVVEPYSFIVTGLAAIVTQHEIDHLAGKLLPDFALPKVEINKKVRPNDPCYCGSNKKYKKCCGR